MLLSAFIRSSIDALASVYPEGEASSITAIWLRSRLGVERYTHILEPEREIPADRLPLLEDDLRRLLRCEPVQYVLSEAEFCSHTFKVGPGVLVPRPETEELVARACELLPDGGRVLDLCTGSGCIAWSIAAARPECRVLGVDISPEALSYAEQQGICSAGPSWLLCDMLVPEAPVKISAALEGGKCELLTCNPPYICNSERALMRRNVLDYEPSLALFAPDADPLIFYRAVANLAAELLVPGGYALVEINETLGDQTAGIFSAAGFENVSLIKDFAGKNRFVSFKKTAL
ncbi:MAG: peptide chain release factor N(5)-glutamine methyltransferase [Bacteroidales bacterium]|nr:peptide chain release factor N(5)-glutamine methyltransferase [Candidatus Cryptobacteroides aphodequi]